MLDSEGFLTSFGWQGKGNGLREGSASRPLAIPQKRTLAGLGKDRDEAFPFWDHLFAAAAKSIKIKVSGDEDETADSKSGLLPESTLHRTATGILSNRRPVSGTPATSGTATPSDVDPSLPRLSLMATAKRESARKKLYAGFFRGPVLGPEVAPEVVLQPAAKTSGVVTDNHPAATTNHKEKAKGKKRKHENHELGVGAKKGKKGKRKDICPEGSAVEELKRKKRKSMVGEEESEESGLAQLSACKERAETVEERHQRKAAKAERRRRKEERRKAKEERRKS